MRDNDKLIEQARLRQIHGHTNELDEWRLRAAGRREEKTMHQNDGSNAAEWADWTQGPNATLFRRDHRAWLG